MLHLINFAILFLPFTFATPTKDRRILGRPTVALSYTTVVGSNLLGIDSFRGIPYAQPPIGNLRLKPPQPITRTLGTLQATGIPRACPQFFSQTNTSFLPANVVASLLNNPFFQAATDAGEDCLTINVQRPSFATPSSKLPVLFWIFGGGFEFGSTQIYDGSELINTSLLQNKSIIYVSVNYRTGGFGFMPGSEILADGSANLGLLDQRLGLQWVADNIAKFGGDPSKVTIWGESAGAISVFDQMALYGGNHTYKGVPLFRAAIMDSGSIATLDTVDCPKGQAVYNRVVANAGCSSAPDTLNCLRSLDYTSFLNAANSVPGLFGYSSLALSYLPRPDGKTLLVSPEISAQTGAFANVPFIIGDQEDEGTIFAFNQANITTTDELVNYLLTYYFQQATRDDVRRFVDTYPDNPAAGSPFNTGPLYSISPQSKRIAALLGDAVFTLARRVFLSSAALSHPNTKTYSYLASYLAGTPFLGTFHVSDIIPAYGILPGIPSRSIQAYYIAFVNSLDPNTQKLGLRNWPAWSQDQQLLHFKALGNDLLKDDFRNASYQALKRMTRALYL